MTLIEIRVDRVRIGVEADRDVPVHREEVWNAIEREKAAMNAGTPTPKTLDQMTNAEFLIEGTKAIEHFTNLIQRMFQTMAKLYAERPNDASAAAIVQHGLLSVITQLADTCNGIELHDESADWVDPILQEAERRGKAYKKEDSEKTPS